MAGTFMVVLDLFIVDVAVSSIQAHRHAGPGAAEWVVAGYGVAPAAFLITAGRLADAFGRRRLFSIGLGPSRPYARGPGRCILRDVRAGARTKEELEWKPTR
jgi:MFS family permease